MATSKNLCLIEHHAMAKLIGKEVQLHALLTSTLERDSSASRLGNFIFGKVSPGINWEGD
jgi:hypothetical protein